MDFGNDKHLDVCQEVETALKREYELDVELTDMKAVFALENAKVAAKRQFGFAKNEPLSGDPEIQGIVHAVLRLLLSA